MPDNSQTNDPQAGINTLGFASVAKEMQENFKQVEEIMAGFSKAHEGMQLDPFNLKQAYSAWMEAVTQNPEKLIETNMAFWQKSMELTQQAMQSFMSGQPAAKVFETPKSDRRFSHEDWENKPAFDVIKQTYLLVSDWTRKVVASAEGLDDHTAERVKFFTERSLDAMSPTNFALTNPAVLEKIRNTKGANLVHGLKNMLKIWKQATGNCGFA